MNWQDFAALAMVAGAALYLVSGFFKKRPANASSACGSACGGCAAKGDGPAVVTLGPVVKR